MNENRLNYNKNIAKWFLIGLALHIPLFGVMAAVFGTEYWVAFGLSTLFLMIPAFGHFKYPGSVTTVHLLAFTTMCFSAIMIHLGKGMIEMHFHIFASMALLPLFGYKGPLVTALLTVAVHHIGFWFFLPASVFNYEASFGIVLIHAVFAATENFGCIFLAHKFSFVLNAQGTSIVKLNSLSIENQKKGDELQGMVDKLTESSNRQASAIQETAATVDQIAAMAQNSSGHATSSADKAAFCQSMAKESEMAIADMGRILEEINGTTEDFMNQLVKGNEEMKQILEAINNISNKTDVINDIVFQTKLLSFNASVEAARAGENGKGFSVVAEEVGNLAAMSGNAAKEIEEILSSSIQTVQSIVDNTDKKVDELVHAGKERNERGKDAALKCRDQLKEIVINVTEVKAMMDKVADASREQADGVKNIAHAMNDLEETTGIQTTATDGVKSISLSLAEQTQDLNLLVSELKEDSDEPQAA